MLEYLEKLDISFFLWLNSFHTSFWDTFMFIATGKEIWLPLYAVLLFVLIKNKKSRAVFPILAILFVFAVCDFVNHDFIKPAVGRLRPSHNPDLKDIVHIVNGYRGGRFSFTSSHAANTFGLAIISSLLIKNWSYRIFIFGWAIITSYSRIYLGVHYAGDMIGGIIFALIVSLLFFLLYKFSMKKIKFGNIQLDNQPYSNSGLIIAVGLVIFFCIAIFSY